MIKGINVWNLIVVQYSAGILEWSDKELKVMDVRIRKILTMYGAFHINRSLDSLYMARKEEGRRLISVKEMMITRLE